MIVAIDQKMACDVATASRDEEWKIGSNRGKKLTESEKPDDAEK